MAILDANTNRLNFVLYITHFKKLKNNLYGLNINNIRIKKNEISVFLLSMNFQKRRRLIS